MVRHELKNLTIEEKAKAAFREAAVSVLQLAKQTQTPIIVLVDNQIQFLSPDEFDLKAAPIDDRQPSKE